MRWIPRHKQSTFSTRWKKGNETGSREREHSTEGQIIYGNLEKFSKPPLSDRLEVRSMADRRVFLPCNWEVVHMHLCVDCVMREAEQCHFTVICLFLQIWPGGRFAPCGYLEESYLWLWKWQWIRNLKLHFIFQYQIEFMFTWIYCMKL